MADAIIRCAGCKYWSDQRARLDKYGVLLAKCLHPTTPKLRWTSGRYSCLSGEPGEAIDTPPMDEALTGNRGEGVSGDGWAPLGDP